MMPPYRFFIAAIVSLVLITFLAVDSLPAEEIDLGQIVIGSWRSPVLTDEVADDVAIVTADQIDRSPGHNTAELLQYVPGIDIEPRQGLGQPTSVSIQGSDSRQVRVMVDGIPFNKQSSGQVNLSQFPITNVRRIEVIKGPVSSIWGSGLGGVINIVTKEAPPEAETLNNVTASFAEFRTRRLESEFSGLIGRHTGFYLFNGLTETGVKANKDDVREKKSFAKFTYNVNDIQELTAAFGYSGAEVNSGIFPDGSWQAQPYRTHYGKIGWECINEDMRTNVELKHSRQQVITRTFLTPHDQEPFWESDTGDFLYQVSVYSAVYPRPDDMLIMGADWDWDILKSDMYLQQVKSVQQQALYYNYIWGLELCDINCGLRYDYNSEFGRQFSPSLGAIYRLQTIPQTKLRVGISRAFTAPPLLWKYNENPLLGIISNPELGPEKALVYEAGLESRINPQLWLKLSLYRADVTDAISWAENESGELFQKNFEKFRRQGTGLQMKCTLSPQLTLFTSGAFNDIEDRGTRQTVRGGGKPRQSFDIGIEYEHMPGLDIVLKGYYDRWNQLPSAEPNDRKMLFDARITRKMKNITLFLNIFNLANSSYWADIFFPVKERYFEGGIRVAW